jgi:hypothetical protein
MRAHSHVRAGQRDTRRSLSSAPLSRLRSIRHGQWFQDRLLGGPQCPADMTATYLGTRFEQIHRLTAPFAQPVMVRPSLPAAFLCSR